MQKRIMPVVIAVIVAVVFAAAGFYGGMMYQKSQTPKFGANFGRNAANFESQAANATRRGGGLQGGFASGEIVARDNESITLKLRDGSTRIIFYLPARIPRGFAPGMNGGESNFSYRGASAEREEYLVGYAPR